MQKFNYTVSDPLGLHARPAGMLVKLVKPYADTTITITKGDKSANANQLMKLMSLAVKKDDEVCICVEGACEAEAAAAVKTFFEENL